MPDDDSPNAVKPSPYLPLKVRFLRVEQIRAIDDALQNVGEFGEVRLVVEKGRLRYIRVEHSWDINKYTPGTSPTS